MLIYIFFFKYGTPYYGFVYITGFFLERDSHKNVDKDYPLRKNVSHLTQSNATVIFQT